MPAKRRVFLDTSALFAAVYSDTGGARLILKLGEAGALSLWIGPRVLEESENVIRRKSPKSLAYFAILLDGANIQIGPEADDDALSEALSVIDYAPDAQVVAEALMLDVDYLVSFDRDHLVGNPGLGKLPFLVGTAGDCLAWCRERW